MTLKDKLEIAKQLIDFAEQRAFKLNNVIRPNNAWYVDYSEIDGCQIDVYFKEATHHDCPESTVVTISLEMLEMIEVEFEALLNAARIKNEQAEKEKEQARLNSIQRQKERQYEQLKKELGK